MHPPHPDVCKYERMVVEERCTSDTSFPPLFLLAYALIGLGEASSPQSVSAKDKKP